MMHFLPLGGADEIGASCFYLNISGTGILLDCGIHPRKNGFEALPDFEPLNNLPLDYAFISHAHQDHIGSLPFLIQKFPHVVVYSTPQTREIAEITLHNAVNILAKNEAPDSNFKIYTHEEIDFLVRFMRDIKYGEELILKGMRHTSVEPIKIKFIDAGHILGSAGVFIEHQQNTMFYTGDINLGDQSIMKGANLDEIKNIDTLILETTYGATDSVKLGTWQSELLRLAKSANKVLNKGGSILIPVFALGKTQEILASIYYLIKKRKLTDTNIYTGGVSKHISRIYDRNKYLVNRYETNFEFSDIKQIDLFDVDDFNQFKKNPGIVLASSGMMLEGTASFKLADYWLKQENFAVFCVGYMDENTPGFKVVNSKKGDVIQLGEFGKPFKIKCGIERFYFASHSRREDLLHIVANSKPKRVILVHGDHSSKDWIGYNILQKHSNIKINSAEVGKSIYID